MASKPIRRVEVVELSRSALIDIEGRVITCPVVAIAAYHVTKKGTRRLVAYGGLIWRRFDPSTGRHWCELFSVVKLPRLCPPMALVRQARRMLSIAAQMGEPLVFCVRDAKWPNSEKLLRLVGFTLAPDLRVFDDGVAQPGGVWTWLISPQSRPS